MNINLVMTTTDKLADEPIQDGKLIYTADKPGHYYDAGGVRLNVNSIQFVNNLPETGELTVLYVTLLESGAGLHIWNGTSYYSFRYIDIDTTLSIPGKAADAASVGHSIQKINVIIENLPTIIIDELKKSYLDEEFEKTLKKDEIWILSDKQYGDTLPADPVAGRFFLLKDTE